MFMSLHPVHFSLAWRKVVKRYLILTGLLNFGWEVLQQPLYSLWAHGSGPEIAFAVLHCTAGDVLIAFFSLLVAWLTVGTRKWPNRRYQAVALTAILLGLVYTVYSEWSNTVVTRSWAYSASMPQMWGIGLSPVAQWLLIPSITFWMLSPQRAWSNARP